MSKRFEVGKYAIDNKSKGTAGPQSTIYKVVSIENATSGVTMLFCRKNCLMVKKLICGVKYVLTT